MKKAENPTDKDADLVLQDLDDKEKELNKLLLSGMENFQPNLNMFASNVFSSMQSALQKESMMGIKESQLRESNNPYGTTNINLHNTIEQQTISTFENKDQTSSSQQLTQQAVGTNIGNFSSINQVTLGKSPMHSI